ncbi:MAG: hypothetical protein M0D55_14760 [Elusimicrobiota bacterium]|nr:MAG: hypothetical protein M0D55_14760 [Elusimicrobiota bacterium]
MKILIAALALGLLSASARAQTEAEVLRSSSQLKEKFKGQRAAQGGGATETAPVPGPANPGEVRSRSPTSRLCSSSRRSAAGTPTT